LGQIQAGRASGSYRPERTGLLELLETFVSLLDGE
jgi:hypothetical protein